ncbi:MAG: hypothetical protein ISR00_03415 [Flavobacteriales bacterium]|nr:hypothetical protein [Flavobacteriales bacterium]MBL6872982.1 hypothetical protein [Flavobacteriales bacterium]
MKKILSILTLTSIALFTFNSCEKETEVIVLPSTISPTPTSEINKFFEDNLENATQTVNINPSTSQTFTSNKGITYTFNTYTFVNSSGVAVSGNIDIELIEALTKKEMMLMNRPTFTHSGDLLVSGGIVYLNATQNGQQLSIDDNNPVSVSIPTNSYVSMDFFDGSFNNEGGFGWDESVDDTVITNTNANDSTGQESWFSFDFEIDSIGWINCDYFYNSGDPLTQVQVVLPDTFNGDNSAVFIYYDDINSVASLSDYDTDGTFDLGANYSTPVGMDVSFVVISESNGSYFYALVNATIALDHIEIIGSMTEVTEAELEIILNNL